MMDSNETYNQILTLRAELLRLKMQTCEFENRALREKIKLNAALKRDLKRQIKEIHLQVQPEIPF